MNARVAEGRARRDDILKHIPAGHPYTTDADFFVDCDYICWVCLGSKVLLIVKSETSLATLRSSLYSESNYKACMLLNLTFLSKRFRQYCGYYGRMILKLVTVAFLAGASTAISYYEGIRIDLKGNNIVTIAVVFPLVFAVNAAYRRRQVALSHLASLKGHALALRMCFAHWNKSNRQHEAPLAAADILLEKFFDDLKQYLSHRMLSPKSEEDIITTFTALSLLVEKLRADDIQPAELALANSFLRNMMVDFEQMKSIHVYRTPSSLLQFLKCFLVLIPIVYGPIYANIAHESGSVAYGIFLAVLFAVVLTALDNTQDVLENPYDGLSPDDIQFRQPTAILHSRVSRSWSEAVPYLQYQKETMGSSAGPGAGLGSELELELGQMPKEGMARVYSLDRAHSPLHSPRRQHN